ncbi:glucose-6-phosphate 1-dehydrogenase [Streptomyces spinoverrucosus]|uniref:Glucose-6-phosphate 1-dehydrogenase n=1 Tax=Streptomyces spinoverrucosus TaxID=284043 RepID=A0A4Y3VP62_9ACTN|nr:glucose-6-phosphate dehydrogenase [Streptomyces spinoverrucosus]GEC08802.1 glucose-6-phosphate 1-dehydrogenase [Streptomyces spinoverrucosus]GHB88794.1 glucose-6-phosphate 1-dehydrogenase [Streptomyces spinoverrucosus]
MATDDRHDVTRSVAPTGRLPDDHVIVICGATGDLARRKLLPGLFHLARAGLLPTRYRIVGSAPAADSVGDEEFREQARQAVDRFGRAAPEGPQWQAFEEALSFGAADPGDPAPLLAAVREAERAVGGSPRRLFHLAVPPVAFGSVVKMLGATGLAEGARVIVEKPFGTDLASARVLNDTLHAVFDESRVFRIDHFLGKESVDNILALRFANGLFEPVWNREHISHVQIDVPESIDIQGRAGFFEGTGTFRDMIVTHLFQLLGFVAMEPPSALDARSLREEKDKVFRSLRPLDPAQVVRGQYEGYRNEPGVAPASDTETFAALRVEIDNWRWAGVPFYLRSGKALAEGRHMVTLTFRQPPLRMFRAAAHDSAAARSDTLAIDFDDPGRITARFLAKEPGPEMRLGTAEMVFDYAGSFAQDHALEAYEHLILEAMLGDQSLFTSADGINRLWEVSEPLLKDPPPVEPYTPGSWGPESIQRLVRPHHWYLPDGR